MENVKFDFDDILIEPAITSSIRSRSEININDDNGNLPLFTAPMYDVIDLKNINIYKSLGINTILPRGKDSDNFLNTCNELDTWYSFSLEDFEEKFLKHTITFLKPIKVLIDIANGHMSQLLIVIEHAKRVYTDKLILMVGNIANPRTYIQLSRAGADYVRCGIGFGGACLTTQQTKIGYPMASLINECFIHKQEFCLTTKIVADGGMKKYSDVIAALSLGADYVMLGSIFNKALESAANTFIGNKKYNSWTEPGDQIDQYTEHYSAMLKSGTKFYKKFRGMSTKEIQKEMGNTKLKTSEGIIKLIEVEYTLSQWIENFSDYLKSAMSYSGTNNLKEFREETEFIFITENSLNRYKK